MPSTLGFALWRWVGRTIVINQSRSKSIEADQRFTFFEALIVFDRFDNHFDWLQLIRPITWIDFDWLWSTSIDFNFFDRFERFDWHPSGNSRIIFSAHNVFSYPHNNEISPKCFQRWDISSCSREPLKYLLPSYLVIQSFWVKGLKIADLTFGLPSGV